MKELNKGILDNEKVISAENVQRMGEVTALCCIKTVIARSGKDLHKLYTDLLHDMNRSKDDYSPFFERIRHCARGNVVSVPTYKQKA